MKNEEIIESFRSFCKEGEFRQFILMLHNMSCRFKRLSPLQEDIWNRFVRKSGQDLPVDFEYVFRLFSICPVHNVPLETDTVPIAYGLCRFPDGYTRSQMNAFPLAKDVLYGGCIPQPERERKLFYCPACREAQAKWRESRQNIT